MTIIKKYLYNAIGDNSKGVQGMISDTITNSILKIIDVLAVIGAAARELLILIPLILAAVFWVLIGNYRDELSFRRLRQSRIGEIDELNYPKYCLFMKAFLTSIGFNEEILPAEEEEENEDNGKYLETNTKKEKKKADIDEPLVFIKDGIRYGVLLEKKKLGVGPLAFNKLEKVMGERECQEGIIINNGLFSKVDLAEGKARDINLWDREWLIKKLLEMQGFEDTEGKDFNYYFYDFWRWALRG